MADNSSHDDGVGYKRPPKWSRFRKGQSGNPHGRPRKKKAEPPAPTESAVDDVLRRELSRMVRVTHGGGAHEIAAFEVVVRAQIQAAAKGNAMAQREVIRIGMELERRDVERRRAEDEEKQKDYENGITWKKLRAKIWAEAVGLGMEPERPWPHPDDILIDHASREWRVRGPLNETDLPYYEYLRTQRDIFLFNFLLLKRTKGDLTKTDFYASLWASYNALLPDRWQIQNKLPHIKECVGWTDLRTLRKMISEYEEEALHWHKLAFPQGERIEFDADVAKAIRPVAKALGFRSTKEYERHLESISGNPPILHKATKRA